MQIKDFQVIRSRLGENDLLFELAPGEYRAWAYDDKPSALFETKVLVLADPTPDDDTRYCPIVFIWNDGEFRDITDRIYVPTVYAVQKIS